MMFPGIISLEVIVLVEIFVEGIFLAIKFLKRIFLAVMAVTMVISRNDISCFYSIMVIDPEVIILVI